MHDYKPGNVWYRYESQSFSDGRHFCWLAEHVITHVTNACVFFDEKRVLVNAKKRWACPTKEEAWYSFQRRKIMQTAILKDQLEHAEAAMLLSKRLLMPPRDVVFKSDGAVVDSHEDMFDDLA